MYHIILYHCGIFSVFHSKLGCHFSMFQDKFQFSCVSAVCVLRMFIRVTCLMSFVVTRPCNFHHIARSVLVNLALICKCILKFMYFHSFDGAILCNRTVRKFAKIVLSSDTRPSGSEYTAIMDFKCLSKTQYQRVSQHEICVKSAVQTNGNHNYRVEYCISEIFINKCKLSSLPR